MINKIAEYISILFFLDYATIVKFLNDIKFDTVGYYYFYSTVAQTFGAILGVVGLFAVFKLETLRTHLEEAIRNTGRQLARFEVLPPEMRNIWHSNKHELYQAVLQEKFKLRWIIETLEDELKKDVNQTSQKMVSLQQSKDELSAILNLQNRVKKSFQKPAYCMAILIFLSLSCLPLGKFFSLHQFLGTFFVVLILMGTFVALWMTVQSIKDWITAE